MFLTDWFLSNSWFPRSVAEGSEDLASGWRFCKDRLAFYVER
ncbi:hypothetical protein SLEP1_g39828 [Rubroshorea leprosula]|uniref:Uncharacterized protein n=1 Tax=Rubroshorea leprosula TaxID=152421 RepID=A0AAV5L259_9ROSI|nr:hypothetical protein SLEP1_g39828 [Rubroshorea leprosula]